MSSMFDGPRNWKALLLAVVLGAPWVALIMTFMAFSSGQTGGQFGKVNLFFYIAAGIVGGPIMVLAIETIGRPIIRAIGSIGEFGGLLALPLVIIRVCFSLPPVLVANAILDSVSTTITSMVERSRDNRCPYAGRIVAVAATNPFGPPSSAGKELCSITTDWLVLVDGFSWGHVTTEGTLHKGEPSTGSPLVAAVEGVHVRDAHGIVGNLSRLQRPLD